MAKSSLKKNIIYQSIYEIFVLIIPFITSPYIARVLGAEKLGIYSFSYSIAYYFVLFAMLGIKNHGNREIAKVNDDVEKRSQMFSNIFALHFIFSIISIVLYVVYAFMFSGKYSTFFYIQGFFVLSSLFDISWFYFGMEKFKLTVTRNTIIKVLNVIAIFTLVKNQGDLWKYTLIMSVGMLISQLALWVPLHKYIKMEKPHIKEMKCHIKPLLILFIPVVAISLYKYMDKIMLGYMSSKVELGLYENSEKAINIPLTIITSIGTVMLPRMSNLIHKDKEQAKKYIAISMKYVLIVAFALSFGMMSVSKQFSVVFWGKEFLDCGDLIFILAVSIPFTSFANIIRTQYLIPKKKDKSYIVSVFVGALVNLVLNYILIPKYSAIGASIATVFAEISVCIMQTYAVRKELTIFKYIKSFLPYLFVGALMFAVLFLIGKNLSMNIPNLIIMILLGGFIYIIVTISILKITKDDMYQYYSSNLKIKLKLK